MLPALIGAAATIGSGLIGASAADKAAAYNYQVDLLNYYQREQERRDTVAAASRNERRTDKQIAESKLGSTDAQGNRTRFVPGQGWVSELAPDQKDLQDLYQDEELAQLTQDLPKKREILNANVARQRGEGGQAQGLLEAFQRITRDDPREIENQLNNASNRGITQGFDSALGDAMRASIRTGASNSGKVAASIGSERAKALENAFMNNKINSRGMVNDEFESKRSNAANLYNMFATRASSMPDVSYAPRNIEGMAGQQQAGAMGATQNAQQMGGAAGAALINAFAKQGGSMSPIEPNYGMANTVAQGGQALSGAFEMLAADRARANALGQYGGYAGINPAQFKQGKGLW